MFHRRARGSALNSLSPMTRAQATAYLASAGLFLFLLSPERRTKAYRNIRMMKSLTFSFSQAARIWYLCWTNRPENGKAIRFFEQSEMVNAGFNSTDLELKDC